MNEKTAMKSELFVAILAIYVVGALSKHNKDDSSVLKALKDSFNKYFIETWPFRKKFPRFGSLQLDVKDFQQGREVNGGWTTHTIGSLLKKAVQGELVRVIVLGSSVSVGAELGCHCKRRTYHYGLSYWWNKTVGAVTGSKMVIHSVTIGGSDPIYFSYCWQDYIAKREEIDLVLWEHQMNGGIDNAYSRSLERLVRSVVKYPTRPGLIMVSFFEKSFLTDSITGPIRFSCLENSMQELVIKKTAEYYAITLLNLQKAICTSIAHNRTLLTVRDLFSGKHPSALAHAQMTFLMTHYMREVLVSFLDVMKFESEKKGLQTVLSEKTPALTLPEPIFLTDDELNVTTKCWTAVYNDYREKPKNSLFSLTVIRNKGFHKIVETDWNDADEVRYDSVGGYQAIEPKHLLALEINIPKTRPPKNSTISIGIRNKYFGGKVKFSLYDAYSANRVAKVYVDSSNDKITTLQVFEFASIYAGKFVFVVKTITGGVLFSSILIS